MDAPPVDLRYIQRGRSSQNPDQVAVRSDVVSFLKSIYESVAECLPDSRDNEFNNVDPLTIPNSGLLDPYCAQLNLEAEQEQKERMFKGLEQQMDKAKKPRKKKKGVEMNLERIAGETGVEEKWLPPGKMKEYYTQYTVVSGLPKAASFPCFWKIWVQEFYMLRFREESQHAEVLNVCETPDHDPIVGWPLRSSEGRRCCCFSSTCVPNILIECYTGRVVA